MYHPPQEFKGCAAGACVHQAYMRHPDGGDDVSDTASVQAVTNGKECSAGQQKSDSMTAIDQRAASSGN
jgi:hypothetical protein